MVPGANLTTRTIGSRHSASRAPRVLDDLGHYLVTDSFDLAGLEHRSQALLQRADLGVGPMARARDSCQRQKPFRAQIGRSGGLGVSCSGSFADDSLRPT
jgi:hypothetical protein